MAASMVRISKDERYFLPPWLKSPLHCRWINMNLHCYRDQKAIKERQSYLLRHQSEPPPQKKPQPHMKSLVTNSDCLHLAAGALYCSTLMWADASSFTVNEKLSSRFHHVPLWVGDVQSISTSKENPLINGTVCERGEIREDGESYTSWAIHWRNNQRKEPWARMYKVIHTCKKMRR